MSYDNNPGLIDKTDREGLILNENFEGFKTLILSAVNELEIERRKDKSEIDRLRERSAGKRLDSTIDAIDQFRNVLKKDEILDKYENYIDGIEKAYDFEVVNVQEPLIMSAGIGTAFLMPAHEIQIQLQGMKKLLDEFAEDIRRMGFYGRIVDKLTEINEIIINLNDISEGAMELSRRKRKKFLLENAIKFAEKIKKPEMEKAQVELIYNVKEKISVNGYQSFFMTCVLNIIDNAIWWLQRNEDKRIIKATIKRNGSGNPVVIFSDNGPGIYESDLPYLGEAFYTRKLNGTGLGLFISKRAMVANNGKIEFGFYDDDPDFLEGANIILIFEGSK